MTVRTRVFVACPYSLFPLDDYKAAFKEVEKGFAVVFIFGDDEITNDHLLRKVHDQMNGCQLALFDITGRNPNVRWNSV